MEYRNTKQRQVLLELLKSTTAHPTANILYDKLRDDFPKISIIMINYNGLKYLKETIPAVLALNYPDFELIFVDNGSTDGSVEFVRSFKSVRLIQSLKLREKNFACNIGVREAGGDFILMCDNDLLITSKNLLTDLYINSKNIPNLGSISLGYYNKNEKETIGYGGFLGFYFIKKTKSFSLEKMSRVDNILVGFPSGVALFMEKKKWLEIGGYDDHLKFGGDDNDLGIKLWLNGYKNYLYSKTLQVHIGMLEREDNKKYSSKWKEMFYAHLYTVVKNYSFFNMLITIIGYSIFAFLKSIKQSIRRLHLGPFFAFFQGYYLFLKNLPIAIKKRKKIQARRVVKEDIFLKIQPPQKY